MLTIKNRLPLEIGLQPTFCESSQINSPVFFLSFPVCMHCFVFVPRRNRKYVSPVFRVVAVIAAPIPSISPSDPSKATDYHIGTHQTVSKSFAALSLCSHNDIPFVATCFIFLLDPPPHPHCHPGNILPLAHSHLFNILTITPTQTDHNPHLHKGLKIGLN